MLVLVVVQFEGARVSTTAGLGQVSTLYAGKLTEQGFITLVFDASYQGESGGEPHFTEIPAARVEDIRCAVDFLSNHPQADEDRIGALGICAGGGYRVNAAQTELRIKAVAGVSTFGIGSACREGVGGMIPLETRMKTLQEVGRQRTREARGEPIRYFGIILIPAVFWWRFGLNEIAAFWFAYVVSRPLGASFADYFGRSRALSGAGLGSGRVAVIVVIAVIGLVGYLAVTRRDIQPPMGRSSDPLMSLQKTPGRSPRRGY